MKDDPTAMPEFLTTKHISAGVDDVINKADKYVYIVSPYLQIDDRTKRLIERQKNTQEVEIRLLYGKDKLKAKEQQWLATNDIQTSFLQNLHAKCYMNEQTAIITSMNLYEFSQKNAEFGIRLNADDEADQKAFQELQAEVQHMLNEATGKPNSQKQPSPAHKPAGKTASPPAPPAAVTPLPAKGFCIQNAKEMTFSMDGPVCKGCAYINNKFKKAVKAKHCHGCGQEHAASPAKPLCPDCWDKYAPALKAAAAS